MAGILLIESAPGHLKATEARLNRLGHEVRSFFSEWISSARDEVFLAVDAIVIDAQCRGEHIEHAIRRVSGSVNNRVVTMAEPVMSDEAFKALTDEAEQTTIARARECLSALAHLPRRGAKGIAWVDAVIIPAHLARKILPGNAKWPPGTGEATTLTHWANAECVIVPDTARKTLYEFHPSGRFQRYEIAREISDQRIVTTATVDMATEGVEPIKKTAFPGK